MKSKWGNPLGSAAFRRAAASLEPLESRRLLSGSGSLVRDISQGVNFSADDFTVVGNTAYFSGTGYVGEGPELWRTDGTDGGFVRVADINPGTSGSYPSKITAAANGIIYFSATDQPTGNELWRSDGTAAGTWRVADVVTGTASSSPASITPAGSRVFFTIDNFTGGRALYVSDGTAGNAVNVSNFSLSTDDELVALGNSLLFTYRGGIYRVDTSNTVTLVRAKMGSETSFSARNLVSCNGEVFFTNNGSGLWRTDGTNAGTGRLVPDVNPNGISNVTVGSITASGNRVYCIGISSTGEVALWRTDGSGNGTMALTTSSSALRPTILGPSGDHSVLFSASTSAEGGELWISDGTTAGTYLLKDTIPGPTSGISGREPLFRSGDYNYFWTYGSTDSSGALNNAIWRVDGTTAGTVRMPAGALDTAAHFVLVGGLGNTAFVQTTSQSGRSLLYRLNNSGVSPVAPAGIGNSSSMSGYYAMLEQTPAFFVASNGDVYFSAADDWHGAELWRISAGDPNGASMVADVAPGAFSSEPSGFTEGSDGSIYFSASTRTQKRNLYRLAPGSSTPVLTNNLSSAGLATPSPTNITAVGDWIYFDANGDAVIGGPLLRSYDPSTGMTSTVSFSSGSSQVINASKMQMMGGHWYFTGGSSGATGTGLYRLDAPGGTAQGIGLATPRNLVVDGASVIYTGTSGTSAGIYRSDGTAAGTVNLLDPTVSLKLDASYELVVQNGIAYFAASTDNFVTERLYRADGMAGGTVPISGAFRYIRQLTPLPGGGFAFVGVGADLSQTIYRSDGTAAGTVAITETWAADGFGASALIPAGGRIYAIGVFGPRGQFSNGDNQQLRVLDGVAGGTSRLVRVVSGTAFSGEFVGYWNGGKYATASDSRFLYLPAYTPETGFEPFRVPLADAPVASVGGPYTVAEGSSVALGASATASTGATITGYQWDFDYDGATFNVDASGATTSFSAATIDGPATRTIAVRAIDDEGQTSGVVTTTVSITNVDPTAFFAAGPVVAVGNASGVSFSNAADPSSQDLANLRYSYDFNNDGDFTDAGDIADSASTNASFTFPASGSYTVHGRVADDDGGFSDYTTVVTVGGPTPPPSTTRNIRAAADAYVQDGSSAGVNFGTKTELDVRKSTTAGSSRESYLRFVLTLNTAVDSAQLRLFVRNSAAGSVTLNLYAVSSTTWSETGINWNNRPAASGSPLASKTISSTTGAWITLDVSQYVAQQRAAGKTAVSFVLRGAATSSPYTIITSDEASTNQPLLVLTDHPLPAIKLSATSVKAYEGSSAAAQVTLNQQPAGPVTVTILRSGGDTDLSGQPVTLTFTPGNWNVPQSVSITAAEDLDATNGTATFSLTADGGYLGASFSAAEVDNDVIRTLRATADAYVRDGTSAGANFGAATALQVRKSSTAGSTRWSLLKFDLSTLTGVASATLRLYGKLDVTTNPSVAVQVFEASNSSWTESGVTWNNKPSASGAAIGQISVAGTTAKWYTLDLTAWLASQRAAGKKSVSLLLSSPAATTSMAVFNSDEASSNQPQLVVKG